MNTHTNPSTAAVTGLDQHTSPAVVTDRAGASMDGQSGGADRAPAAAIQVYHFPGAKLLTYRGAVSAKIAPRMVPHWCPSISSPVSRQQAAKALRELRHRNFAKAEGQS